METKAKVNVAAVDGTEVSIGNLKQHLITNGTNIKTVEVPKNLKGEIKSNVETLRQVFGFEIVYSDSLVYEPPKREITLDKWLSDDYRIKHGNEAIKPDEVEAWTLLFNAIQKVFGDDKDSVVSKVLEKHPNLFNRNQVRWYYQKPTAKKKTATETTETAQ